METVHLDFTIDFETCSLAADAAIMQVAIVPWWRDHEGEPFMSNDNAESFVSYVDLRTCVVEGMRFDPRTIEWWSHQSDDAKQSVCKGSAKPIIDVFVDMLNFIHNLVNKYNLKSICLWAHGMDVDIAILRSLCHRFNTDLEKIVPHTQFRDCRTIILEAAYIESERSVKGKSTKANGIALPPQILTEPSLAYKLFEPLPARYDGCMHDAIYDAISSTWYTWQALNTLRS